MAKERRDSKNRILRPGEYQKADGRYMYRYKDVNDEDRYVYSWTLTQSDRTPPGKTVGKCLRELEKEIAKDIHDEIDSYSAKNATLNDRFDLYMENKRGIKESTKQMHIDRYNCHVRDSIGKKKIADLRYSHMLAFYSSLVNDKGMLPSSATNVFTTINPVFRIAVRDRLIRDNPQTGVMAEINKECGWKKSKRHALTVEEQKIFFQYVKNHKTLSHWWPVLTVAVGTGCRVGELIALTWDDCDFTNNIITVNKSIITYRSEGSQELKLHVTTPKTEAGNREIPMLSEVKEILLEEKKRQLKYGFCEDIIDGYSGFVFKSKHGHVIYPKTITSIIKRFILMYNKEETGLAKEEKRKPKLLPDFSVHTLRHTFCTRLCENGANIKVVQEVMGHSTISMTMDIYNEATRESKMKSFEQIEKKVIVS